jgi:hypothetical protein
VHLSHLRREATFHHIGYLPPFKWFLNEETVSVRRATLVITGEFRGQYCLGVGSIDWAHFNGKHYIFQNVLFVCQICTQILWNYVKFEAKNLYIQQPITVIIMQYRIDGYRGCNMYRSLTSRSTHREPVFRFGEKNGEYSRHFGRTRNKKSLISFSCTRRSLSWIWYLESIFKLPNQL